MNEIYSFSEELQFVLMLPAVHAAKIKEDLRQSGVPNERIAVIDQSHAKLKTKEELKRNKSKIQNMVKLEFLMCLANIPLKLLHRIKNNQFQIQPRQFNLWDQFNLVTKHFYIFF